MTKIATKFGKLLCLYLTLQFLFEKEELMSMKEGKNLVIVESPGKIKKIQSALGDGYIVKASIGHIRDLDESGLSIDIENGFKPEYVVPADKKKVVADLKKEAKAASAIWLASDADREGEAISWHLYETLGLSSENTKRIVFQEITKPAILSAIENPREIDMNLVNAQQARRVLDRLVGFELSPVLWRKIQPKLSAGRVQSVALRLIVDREREILAFNNEAYYKVEAVFHPEGTPEETLVKATLDRRFPDMESAQAFLEKCIGAEFTICNMDKKEGNRFPAPPFTTSTLQQEAARKLRFSVSQTMSIAQHLYENGYITYMRTDSTNLSALALGTANRFLCDHFGEEYSKMRNRWGKVKGAQEAHEAIRPTYIDNVTIEGTPQEKKLYELIWKRTVASQMADATLETMSIDIDCNGYIFRSTGSIVTFPGYLGIYQESFDEAQEEEMALPPMNVGDKPDHIKTEDKQHFTQPPARYTEASLIKAMEERGIGRPSTYAPTISIITDREYVVKENKTLKPTLLGEAVTDLMVDKFSRIADSKFTAEMENQLDEVEHGKNYKDVLREFYADFDASMKKAEKDLQDLLDKYIKKVDDTLAVKEKELMAL